MIENTNTVGQPADVIQEHVFDCHDEIRRLKKAIRNMMSHAGAVYPDIACRAVIACGQEALNGKEANAGSHDPSGSEVSVDSIVGNPADISDESLDILATDDYEEYGDDPM